MNKSVIFLQEKVTLEMVYHNTDELNLQYIQS